jgi:hypothetical protein
MNEVSITGTLKRFRNEKLFPVWAIFLFEVCDIPESNLGIPATRRALAAVSQAGMRNTARDDEGARVLISTLLRLLDLSRWLSLNSWTATACCRFREASLLAVEGAKTMFRRGALALAAAERFLR